MQLKPGDDSPKEGLEAIHSIIDSARDSTRNADSAEPERLASVKIEPPQRIARLHDPLLFRAHF